jgi:predicted PurR-regulated permease PerM
MPRPDPPAKSSRFLVPAAICVVVAALYFAQDVLVPLALAVLFCFLLAPVVTRLERFRLGRAPAVIVVVAAAAAVVLALGWVVSLQVHSLAENISSYRAEIVEKAKRVGGIVSPGKGGLTEKIKDLTVEAQRAMTQPASQPAATQPATQPGDGAAGAPDALDRLAQNPAREIAREAVGAPPATAPPIGTTRENPYWTVALPEPQSALQTLASTLGVVASPLGTAGLVLVFVIFMLIGREDLRDRLIRLVGHGQLNVTTQALDDAASRISRYMMAQAIVNGTYGLAVAIGLWCIGKFAGGGVTFPSFVLWGLLCAILRFIPYVGPWIAAVFPIVLSLAVFHGFGAFFWTVGMFVAIELLSNNLMEPYLYGSSTGMSTVAVLASAVFWTWLWGPVGLLLATPLTVVLVVLGKYVPQLQFLDILLGDEPVLEPPTRVYQRLLALDQEEAYDVARGCLRESSLEQVFDDVLVPALALAEQDRHRGRLDDERADFIRQAMRQLVEELADDYKQAGVHVDEPLATTLKEAAAETVAAAKSLATRVTSLAAGGNGGGNGSSSGAAPAAASGRAAIPRDCKVNVVCLPAHDDADDVVAFMLQQLLEIQGYCAFHLSVTKLASEMMDAVESHQADAVVVSAIPPGAVSYSRYLCKRLHARFSELNLVVGLWTMRGGIDKARERVTCEGSVRIVTRLGEAMDEVTQLVQPALMRQAKQREAAQATT